MTKRVRDYEESLHEALRDPAEAAAYINAHLEQLGEHEDAEKALLLALSDVMRAHGVGSAASRAGLQRTNVQRAMSGKTDPRLSTVVKMLGSARLRLAVQPEARTTVRQRKRA